MPKKGTFTALQRLRPITTDFGDIVEAGVEDILADKAQEEAKKKAISKQFGLDYDGLVDVVTKTKSIDEAFARGINSARDSMGEIYKQIERTPSMANDVKTQIKLQNLKNYSKNLKLISDRYSVYADTVGKGMMAGGNLSNWNKDILSDLDSIFRQANLDVRVDKETGLPIAIIAELDENGLTTGKLKELNLIEVLDGRGLTDTVEKYDFIAGVIEIGNKLGKQEETVINGFTTITYQKWEGEVEESARTIIRGEIGNEMNPSPVAKSVWSDKMGEDPKDLNAEDMKRIEDFLTSSVQGFYDEKNIKKKAFGAQEAAIRRRKKAEKEKGLGIRLRTDEEGRPTKKNLVGVSTDLKGPALQYTLPKDLTVGIKGQNRLITDLYLTDDGKIAYEETNYTKAGKTVSLGEMLIELEGGTANRSDYTVSSSTEGGLTTDELNEIARDLDLPDAGALKDELERVRDEKLGKTKKEIEGF